ncbi:MAG: amino acid permease [Bacteroidetes bacterium]|nr:MAG: amino acid permease [Bacteroidota bacterium]
MLNRGIQKWDLVLMTINSIIGAGIFGLPSKILPSSGVYSVAAFFACAAVVLIFILCFAEVSSRFDKTGGPYIYTLASFGRFPAFLLGWLLLLSRIFTYATLINLVPTYLSFFSPQLSEPYVRVAIMLAITTGIFYVNHIGVKNLAAVSNFFTVSKLLPLAVFIIVGLFYLQPSLFTVKHTPTLDEFSNSVLLLVFAFGGFETVLITSGEIKNPAKTLPFALLTATAVVAFFYILIQVVSMGTLPTLASSSKPLADAAVGFMGNGGGLLITIGAVVSILGTLMVIILGGSRMPFALSEEKQFPALFSYVHPTYKTPTSSILAVSVVAFAVAVSWTFISALTISAIIRVTYYLVGCASLIQLRRVMKDQTGFYKVPYGNIIAAVGILLSLWLLSTAKTSELRNALIFLLAGAFIYLLQLYFIKRK